jgi:hypothetical protein
MMIASSEQHLSGYDVVLNTLGPDVLEKSLEVLRCSSPVAS